MGLPSALPLLLALLLASPLVAHALRGARTAQAAGPPRDNLSCCKWNSNANCAYVGNNTRRVTLNAQGGAGLQSPRHYINGVFSLSIKLPPGNSTGVVFAWYLMDTQSHSNKDPNHSEIDFEIYGGGNATQAMLATNIFCNGQQNLAQFNLSFDPSAAFHTYTVKWNAKEIVWFVDTLPIRILNRHIGQPWPMYAMKPMASIWLAPWVQHKIDPSVTPISAEYGGYTARGCTVPAWATQQPRAQCAGPWNWALTPTQIQDYHQNHYKMVLADYGWDNA